MTASPRSIRVLPQSMINKIAAGEVIERPASVVKELVENAVDAGATRIDVLIEQGGADLIRIVDNGCGIRPDQLELALSPHATSKIVEADDLFKILTFGFRGEALASIAEISQMTVKSRVENSNEGSEIQSNGGQRTVPIPCGMPVGTQIEVRNLFFNTPVRRKYMKSATTEFGHVAETFVRLALPQPGIHFTLRHAGRVVHDLPPERQRQPFMLSRVRQLFGEEVAKEMIAIESRPSSIVKVHGLVSHPNHSRANNRMQYFFLNGRFIRDKALQHALMEAYRGILTVGRFPLAFLHVELPPDHFDVNVHPTKMEVRFLDSNKVYSGFLGAIRDKFLSTDLHGRFSASASKSVPSSSHADATDPRSAMEGASTAEVAESKIKGTVQDWINRENDTDRVKHAPSGLPKSGHSATAPSYRSTAGLSLHALPSYGLPPHDFGQPKTAPISSDRMAYSPQGKIVVQMHDRYLVMETAAIGNHSQRIDEGVVFEGFLRLEIFFDIAQIEQNRFLRIYPDNPAGARLVRLAFDVGSLERNRVDVFRSIEELQALLPKPREMLFADGFNRAAGKRAANAALRLLIRA